MTGLTSVAKTAPLRVDLGDRSYDIIVDTGLLGEAGRLIAPFAPLGRVIVVTDENVAGLHLDALRDGLDRAAIACETIVTPAGERSKEFTEFERLINAILDTRPERRSLLVALGGGVVGDLTGFAASVLLRGVDFVQIPTTLLAQVDSSVGGKTGINTRHGKNLIGAFYQPRLVLADTDVLKTLPRRELLAGYAEVVKYGLINDPAFFEWLEWNGDKICAGDPAAQRHAVLTSCAAKAAVVAVDEREGGQRALLNLGHTFGHALEAETGFGEGLLHGEAVAIGMALAFDLSVRLGLCPAEDAARVRSHLTRLGLPTTLDALARDTAAATLLDHMRSDKKVRDGRLTFILARGIGQAFVTDNVDPGEVEALLRQAIAA